jgi:hypothetical protein
MIKFNDWELDSLYEKVEDLRKQVKEKAMKTYNYIKELNKNDQLYGWMFNCNAILNDTPEDLDIYQKPYIRDILTVYKNELENILIKEDL